VEYHSPKIGCSESNFPKRRWCQCNLLYPKNVLSHVDETLIGYNLKKIKPVSLIYTNVIQKPGVDVSDKNEIHLK
jgi:hypothetical protein